MHDRSEEMMDGREKTRDYDLEQNERNCRDFDETEKGSDKILRVANWHAPTRIQARGMMILLEKR